MVGRVSQGSPARHSGPRAAAGRRRLTDWLAMAPCAYTRLPLPSCMVAQEVVARGVEVGHRVELVAGDLGGRRPGADLERPVAAVAVDRHDPLADVVEPGLSAVGVAGEVDDAGRAGGDATWRWLRGRPRRARWWWCRSRCRRRTRTARVARGRVAHREGVGARRGDVPGLAYHPAKRVEQEVDLLAGVAERLRDDAVVVAGTDPSRQHLRAGAAGRPWRRRRCWRRTCARPRHRRDATSRTTLPLASYSSAVGRRSPRSTRASRRGCGRRSSGRSWVRPRTTAFPRRRSCAAPSCSACLSLTRVRLPRTS